MQSAYANDPRVFDYGDGDYEVKLDDGRRASVSPGATGGFIRSAYTGDLPEAVRVFDTADEAIRSLIGDPQ